MQTKANGKWQVETMANKKGFFVVSRFPIPGRTSYECAGSFDTRKLAQEACDLLNANEGLLANKRRRATPKPQPTTGKRCGVISYRQHA